jgi:uncharacterized protein YodC (DUF2158 family)
MAGEQFRPGDLVRLRSGGPSMTIESVGISSFTEEPTVFCVWFDGKMKQRDNFAAEAVEATPKPSGPPEVFR